MKNFISLIFLVGFSFNSFVYSQDSISWTPIWSWETDSLFLKELDFDLNPVSGNLIVSSYSGEDRVNAFVVDKHNGQIIGNLQKEGIVDGIFPLARISISQDGQIFGTNLTVNEGNFKLYRWENESSLPETIFDDLLPFESNNTTGYSNGRSFGVYGSTNEVMILYPVVYTYGNDPMNEKISTDIFKLQWDGDSIIVKDKLVLENFEFNGGFSSEIIDDKVLITPNNSNPILVNINDLQDTTHVDSSYHSILDQIAPSSIDDRGYGEVHNDLFEFFGTKYLIIGPVEPFYTFHLFSLDETQLRLESTFRLNNQIQEEIHQGGYGQIIYDEDLNNIFILNRQKGFYSLDLLDLLDLNTDFEFNITEDVDSKLISIQPDSLILGMSSSVEDYIWTSRGDILSNESQLDTEISQGTNDFRLSVTLNSGKILEFKIKYNLNSGYRSFDAEMSDGAGISMVGTDNVFIPIKGGTMQILDDRFNDINTLSVDGEIRSVSSISQDKTVYIASTDKRVYTFNKFGIPIWDSPLGGELKATPTIDVSRDLVYVGVSNSNFFAVNRSTGSVVWSSRLDSPISQPGVILEDKYLIVVSTGGTVYYFNLDGEVNSQVLAPEGILSIGENIVSAPALDAAGYLYLASTTGTIRKFEFRDDLPNKGQVIWEVNTQSEFYTSPVIGFDGTVYVGGADSTLYALNGQNSSLKWSKKLGAAISTTATINEYGVLYIGDSNGTMYAMSDTGEPIWYYETGSEIGNATAYAGGHLYFATADGELLKVYDGWRYEDIQGKAVWASKAPQWGTYQGNFRRSGNLSEASVINSVEPLQELPQDYALSQNYPNPFNPTTKINYSLPELTQVRLEIFSMLGQKVATLVDTQQSAGYHTASFEASGLSSGMYLYKLTTSSFTEIKTMLLIK